MADTETTNYLDCIQVDEFEDGTVVVHTDTAAMAVRVVARRWYRVDVDEWLAVAFALQRDMDIHCEVELVRHAEWPAEDGGVGEQWFTRDPGRGPTGEHKPGVIFDEEYTAEIEDAFDRGEVIAIRGARR